MSPLNILFLTAHLPVLGLHGGGMRMYYNLKILAEKHRVSLLSFIESEREKESLPELEKLGVAIKTILRRPGPARHLLVAKPREHDEYHSIEMTSLVRKTLDEQRFDVVQAEFVQMGQHVPGDPALFKILTEHEIQFANAYSEFCNEVRPAARTKKFYDWMVQLNYEVRMCRRFDRVVCMTDEDLKILSPFMTSGKLRKIHIGVDSDYFSPVPASARRDLSPRMLFVGNYRHLPNQDAVSYFARHVFPLLRRQIPTVELCIAGANADMMDRQSLESIGNIKMTGYVPDVRECYRDADIFVAPLRTGNGMRVKLLEAFSMGMAVVASPLAISGFNGKPEEHFLLADSPERFATQALRLLENPALKERLGSNARKMIRQYYDWKVLAPQFLELVENRHA